MIIAYHIVVVVRERKKSQCLHAKLSLVLLLRRSSTLTTSSRAKCTETASKLIIICARPECAQASCPEEFHEKERNNHMPSLPRKNKFGCHFGLFKAILGYLGPGWGHPEAILGPKRPQRGHLGVILSSFEPLLGPTWAILEPTCSQFGTNLCHPGPNLGTANLKIHCFSLVFQCF